MCGKEKMEAFMKIAIPVDKKDIKTEECVSFGRAPYFMIYDTEANEAVFLDNSAAATTGGAGIKAAQAIVDSGAELVLARRCGENAAEVLKAADIKIFKTRSSSAKENIDAFIAGELSQLDEIHAGFHGHHGGN